MWYLTRRKLVRAAFSWGPVLAAMALMFIASSQPKYGPPDTYVSGVYFSGAVPVFPGLLELLLKKSAHVIAFGALAALNTRALIAHGLIPRRAGYLAIVLTVLYALIDETRQSSTYGRTASGIDIGLDFIGATLSTFIARLYWDRRSAARLGARTAAPAKPSFPAT